MSHTLIIPVMQKRNTGLSQADALIPVMNTHFLVNQELIYCLHEIIISPYYTARQSMMFSLKCYPFRTYFMKQ